MIVFDTNVVSELMKAERDPSVERWVKQSDDLDQRITAFTVEEITFGLARLPQGRRRQALMNAWEQLGTTFADAILPYRAEEAEITGILLAATQARGLPLSQPDAQIAGTCLAHGATLVTRNVSDFNHIPELELVNPFSKST